MKKYTIYKDDRAGADYVKVSITKPTKKNSWWPCDSCGRSFKRYERVLKISFRRLGPRCICTGCAAEILTDALIALGRVYKKGKGLKQDPYPEWLTPKKHIETDDDIPF